MKKVALITGINGQDGSYLAQFLLSKNYEVHGTVRNENTSLWRLTYLGIRDVVSIHHCSLQNTADIEALISSIKPTEIYHLAAQSSIPLSKTEPEMTLSFNYFSTLSILEYVRKSSAATKVFHASTSEMFDPNAPSPITKNSPLKPIHPYGASKAACHLLVQSYRNSFDLYVVNGILFPHESPIRNRGTFLEYIISQAKKVASGEASTITVGEPQNIRDFGDARSYVKAMWHSLQASTSDDYTICSGAPLSIQEILDFVIAQYKLNPKCIKIDNTLVRQPNIPIIYCDPTETTQKIGWKNSISIFETIESIIMFNNEKAKHEF